MAVDNKFVRCEADDPQRCQAMTAKSQCPYKASDGSQYCPMHGGIHAIRAAETKRKRIYNLAKWQDRISEHADHDQVKSLREEIGIARIILEGVMDTCKDSSDLLLYSNKISDLVVKIEKLVSSCNRLETSTGMLLDKQAALQIASSIVGIIARHVTDEDLLEKIADEIVPVIVGGEKK